MYMHTHLGLQLVRVGRARVFVVPFAGVLGHLGYVPVVADGVAAVLRGWMERDGEGRMER